MRSRTARALSFLSRFARVLSLALLAVVGTTVLVRFAPGYFTNTNELDAEHASLAREQLQAEQQREGSLLGAVATELRALLHGDLGRSRHFDVPVSGLVRERAAVTANLLVKSVVFGWLGALTFSLLVSLPRTRLGGALVAPPMALLLAVPAAALATVCLVGDFGGPVLVLSLLIGARDFQLLHRLLRETLRGPQFLYARAQGLPLTSIVFRHLLPTLRAELLALAMTSFVLALSAAVPVEVIFDLPGLGQLAWNAATNRDLSVLLAVTLLMAVCVGVASLFAEARTSTEAAQCA